MEAMYSLPLQKFVKELSLEVLFMPDDPAELTRADINRPGLPWPAIMSISTPPAYKFWAL